MSTEMTPLMKAASGFAYRRGHRVHRNRRVSEHIAGAAFTHCCSLCISAISFSWIEAPYDWAMYAQFPPAIPRMPSWWPLNMTWGGLPLFVPIGYISYFVLPAVIGRGARAMAELEVPLAQADHPPDRRPRRRLLLGTSSSTGSWAPSSASSTTAA